MGHEGVGEVEACGEDVKVLTVGDMVCTAFTTCCGQCFYCLEGLTCRCVKGGLFGWRSHDEGLHGWQAEFVRVPLADSTLKKVPQGASLRQALLMGDILATGFFCADNADLPSRLRSGVEVHVAVVGCGPVGQLALLSARDMGAGKNGVLLALDTISSRLP
eukprot:CAMPEP_0175883890 /NCGR_PEP_ID=MMETSP0107_2-20121207/44224_1 /TAXON_ID=195067 ORGANISM="Goniomonas pacifica, Strain CCMP1869" /NCGR_SAMPLE_ID=MMETSP0107_2 /ASSEMBLY_ACC=CAM_ASM_000203 /LENGTH=160 /DNA_ID=CAMNT_0017203995 /DNA_START=113 /DNA_END=595 /DNA_ORIENTATION=-